MRYQTAAMDASDAKASKQTEDEKKAGTDQVTAAANEDPNAPRRAYTDEGGCTLGEPGKLLCWVALGALAVYWGV